MLQVSWSIINKHQCFPWGKLSTLQNNHPLIARYMGPCRSQMGPMLAPWILLSGPKCCLFCFLGLIYLICFSLLQVTTMAATVAAVWEVVWAAAWGVVWAWGPWTRATTARAWAWEAIWETWATLTTLHSKCTTADPPCAPLSAQVTAPDSCHWILDNIGK